MRDLNEKSRRRVAFAATGIALSSVVVAATIGVQVLTNWGISTGALLIAAGIILFLVALQSIRSQYSPADDYLVPVLVVVASVLAVLQAALGVHAVLTGLKLAGVT